jgi:hypothetical protein
MEPVMTKQRLKECLLCGALLRAEMTEAHEQFHKSTPQVPKRTTVTTICSGCGQPMQKGIVIGCETVGCPRHGLGPLSRPPVLEEPSRRPPAMREITDEERRARPNTLGTILPRRRR